MSDRPIHAFISWKGRSVIVGRLDADKTFVKTKVYMVNVPPSLAIGADTVAELQSAGCQRMRLTTQDGAVYQIPFEKFVRKSFVQTRTASAGKQYFCPIENFERLDAPKPPTPPSGNFPIVDKMRERKETTTPDSGQLRLL